MSGRQRQIHKVGESKRDGIRPAYHVAVHGRDLRGIDTAWERAFGAVGRYSQFVGVGGLLLGGMRAVNLGNDKESGCALERQKGGREEFRQHDEISEVNTDRREKGNRETEEKKKKGQYISFKKNECQEAVSSKGGHSSKMVRSGRDVWSSEELSLSLKRRRRRPRRKKQGGS